MSKSPAENFFKILADQTRLHILMLLHLRGELCVCEITHALNLSQPKISRHIALLKEFGVVDSKKEGKWVYYKISSASPHWHKEIFELIQKNEVKEWQVAIERLSLLTLRSEKRTLCSN